MLGRIVAGVQLWVNTYGDSTLLEDEGIVAEWL
jgi:hypothetical protein